MKFNAKKCYFLSIKNKISFYCSLNNKFFKHIYSYPYLDVCIAEGLKWYTHKRKPTSPQASSGETSVTAHETVKVLLHHPGQISHWTLSNPSGPLPPWRYSETAMHPTSCWSCHHQKLQNKRTEMRLRHAAPRTWTSRPSRQMMWPLAFFYWVMKGAVTAIHAS